MTIDQALDYVTTALTVGGAVGCIILTWMFRSYAKRDRVFRPFGIMFAGWSVAFILAAIAPFVTFWPQGRLFIVRSAASIGVWYLIWALHLDHKR